MHTSLTNARHRKNDLFFTPVEVAKKCISTMPVANGDVLYDPFYGDTGPFYEHFREPREWAEIRMGRDFFDRTEPVDFICSNPPFSILTQVLQHSCKVCRKGFGYIILSTALTLSRLNLCRSHGFELTRVGLIQNRRWFGYPCLFVVFERGGAGVLSFAINVP